MGEQITCPQCSFAFEPTEVMRQQIEAATRKQVEEQLSARVALAEQRARSEAEGRLTRTTQELETMRAEAARVRELEASATAKEAEVLRQIRELDGRERGLALELERRLGDERTALRVKIEAEAEQRHQLRTTEQLATIRSELEQAQRAAKSAIEREAQLEVRARELEHREAHIALDLEQKLTTRSIEIRTQAEAAADARHSSRAQAALAVMQAEVDSAREAAKQTRAQEAALARRSIDLEEREQRAAYEIEAKLAAERKTIRAVAERESEQRLKEQLDEHRASMATELEDSRRRATEANQREVEVIRRAAELEAKEAGLELQLQQRLSEERQHLRQAVELEATQRAELAARTEREESAARLQKADARSLELAKRESEALRRARELEERLQLADVEVERKLTENALLIAQRQEEVGAERIRTLREQHRLVLEEHKLKNAQLERTAQELQQRLAQGSQQLQGEAQEVLLRDMLMRTFPHDRIEDVPTGMAGADVLQHVRDPLGSEAGLIIWESKRTRGWTDSWLSKLRDNQREAGAVVAVIVSQALPDGLTHFGQREGAWVCSWSAVLPVAAVLRSGLLEIAAARRVAIGAGQKQNLLFDYMTGPDFRNRISGVVEAFTEMQEDLQAERRAMLRQWNKREKQLDRAVRNLSSLYGDLQGIVGKQIEDLALLELPGSTSSTDDFELEGREDDNAALLAAVRQHLLRLLPADGGTLGNGMLRDRIGQQLVVDLDTEAGKRLYDRCVDRLVSEGKVRKGRGRGGSLSRTGSGSAEDLDDYDLDGEFEANE